MRMYLFSAISLIFVLVLIGCQTDEVEKEEPEEEAVEVDAEEEELSEEEETEDEADMDKEMEKMDEENLEEDKDAALENADEEYSQGDYDIYIGGEVIEADDKIVIEGESNLIPGSRVVGEVSVSTDTNYYWARETKEYEYLADTTEIVDENGDFN